MQTSIDKISELHSIIAKMALNECWSMVLPEFGARWHQVSKAVRNARLPMTSASVAEVLCRQAARVITEEDLDDILGRIKLKFVATQTRTWHVINLLEPTTDEPVAEILRTLEHRVIEALRNNKINNAQVRTISLGSLVYISIQAGGGALYAAAPPGQALALLSSAAGGKRARACVQGLGYARYENANLHGSDIPSLLRIANPISNGQADQLSSLPPYDPVPCILPNGIDYTTKTYDERYVDLILGPNPPLLTHLNIKMSSKFYDSNIIKKKIKLNIKLKSDNVAESLKSWVGNGGLAPNSCLFQIFHNIKSNEITYNGDSSD